MSLGIFSYMKSSDTIGNPLRKGASAEERRALDRVGARPRSALTWAVERFLQTAADERALRVELAVFLRPLALDESLPIPSAAACAAAQARVNQIVTGYVVTGRALVADRGRYWVERGRGFVFEPMDTESGRHVALVGERASTISDESWALSVALEVARLLDQAGQRVKRCTAPRSTTIAHGPIEECGRLFVGRPNRRYCSTPCGNRATTFKARHGERTEETYKGRRIELASYESKTEPK